MPIVATLLPRADGDGVHLYASGTQESGTYPGLYLVWPLRLYLLRPFYYLQESLEHFVRLVAQKLMPPLFNMAALF